ncbi:MAG TPA: hypothetical protein VEX86_27640 [Longimicrobium sp.]|nr:hypothetical protein [Longimicrobium sp.]
MDRTFTQIPTLRGGWLRAARAAWFAGATVSLVLTILGAYRWSVAQRDVMPAFRALDVAMGDSRGPGGLRVLTPVAGGVASAGMRQGALVAVDGAAVAPGATPRQIAARLRGKPGTPVVLTLRHDGGATARYRLVRQPPGSPSGLGEARRAALLGAVSMVYVLGLMSVAVLLFARCPGDPAALAVSLSFALIAAGNPLTWFGAPGTPVLEPVLRTMVYSGIVLGFWFFCIFPDGRIVPAWTRAWMIVVPAYAALIEFVVAPRSAPAFYGLVAAGMAIGVVAQVQRFRRAATPTQRQQTKWVVAGVAASVVLYGLGGLVVPLIPAAAGSAWGAWREVVQETLTSWGLLPVPAGLAISLMRYRLWDADAVLSRSATYALLTVVLAAAWAGMSQATQGVLGGMMGADSGAAAGAVAAALTVALFNPTHDRVRHWADRRFMRDLVEFRERLPTVVGDLRETEDLDGLLAVALSRVCIALRCERAAVFLEDGAGRTLAAARGVPADAKAEWPDPPDGGTVVQEWRDPVFPVRVRLAAERGGTPTRVGWLALGPRPDGSAYGRDELDALAAVAGPIARAVWIVRARAEHEAALERRLQSAEDELRHTRAELASLRTGVS